MIRSAKWLTFCQTRAGECLVWTVQQWPEDTGEDKMSQSAVFPFFDRLLRQEVFPGKPKGVAEQLPIDLLALPEKAHWLCGYGSGERDWTRWNTLKLWCEWPSVCLQVSFMTELFRTLRIAEEICLKLSFISGLTCLVVCLWQLINSQVPGCFQLRHKMMGMASTHKVLYSSRY